MTGELTHVLFDLDGTLADTAPDLGNALNRVLVEHGRPPLPQERIRPAVSLGGAALIKLGFGLEPGAAEFPAIRDRFLELYRGGVAEHSHLFPGMGELLARLEQLDYRWGIVTNKSGWLTAPLLDALELAQRASCVVSGDTTPHAKPHPAPLLHACELLGCRPQQAVYVGDARRDVEAGRSAGTATVVAAYGYIPDGEDVRDWGADALIQAPHELLSWLNANR